MAGARFWPGPVGLRTGCGPDSGHLSRGFLQALVLSGETQERERVLYQFSRRFHHCNPGLFPSVGKRARDSGCREGGETCP